ncbi:hypothetical protein HC024_00220 [Methylococcaceae bacterium WWC4]|nr:hypothetical protein [Methylococcaceae bacterium WWC4]
MYGYYLVRHVRESDDKYERRKQLAVYPNFCRKIVDVFMGFLWRKDVYRETSELYSQFMKNADGAGTKLDSLLFTYQRLAMILGTVYVIVDKPETQGQTRADQALPYLALRLPGQLADESKDGAGAWTSVTFSEVYEGETVYRTYSRTGWVLSKKPNGSDIIKQGQHSLGRVPVVRLHISKPLNPTECRSLSWFHDLAGLNWSLFNLDSEQRELFRQQTFAILALPVTDDAEREKLKDLTIGTENALTYNPTGGGKPEFIAPPPDPIQLYAEKMAALVTDIYRVANLEFVGGVQQSGVALSFHFQECNSSLAGMAEMCEVAENDIADLVYLWQGQSFDGTISYPDDFNLTDLAAEMSTAMDALTMQLGAEFDKALKKRVARQILSDEVAPNAMTAIDKEIDAQGDTHGDRIARQAGIA